MLITQTLARELAVQERQIEAAVALLDSGATVPFISRYRKEATVGFDDESTSRHGLEPRLGSADEDAPAFLTADDIVGRRRTDRGQVE